MTDGFEHGATMILGIELREGGNLAGEQEVEVLLGDVQIHSGISIDWMNVRNWRDAGVWNSNWSISS